MLSVQADIVLPGADSSGVIVTTSPVDSVAVPVAAPSAIVTVYSSSPYVTVYSYFVCASPS